MNSATNVEYDNSSIYTNTYTTFSGCDIVCSFGSQVIGELQGISYSVESCRCHAKCR